MTDGVVTFFVSIGVAVAVLVFVVSPIMNWFNGYGFTIIF